MRSRVAQATNSPRGSIRSCKSPWLLSDFSTVKPWASRRRSNQACEAPSTPADRCNALWTYYDRRAPAYQSGVRGTQRYFSSVGVDADPEIIAAELEAVRNVLLELPPAPFLDVGAGPGVFTALLPGSGFALDQSESVLRRLRADIGGVPVVRGDVIALPVAAKAVRRVFAGHLYGHLEEEERMAFLFEARRVGDELLILDSGRPHGANAKEWQTRTLPDGTSYTVYKRHFEMDVLLAEIGGESLFDGRYYVLARCAT
jgi:SAM-dependent methyltransferase